MRDDDNDVPCAWVHYVELAVSGREVGRSDQPCLGSMTAVIMDYEDTIEQFIGGGTHLSGRADREAVGPA